MKYTIFVRTWYRLNPKYPNGLEPHLGKRSIIDYANTIDEAREICRKYNEKNNPGRLSRKAEVTSDF
jgi:hypothetical protein